MEWIRYGGVLIYVDDIEAYYVNDALERMFDNMIESIKDNIIVELEDEGYEHERHRNRCLSGLTDKYIKRAIQYQTLTPATKPNYQQKSYQCMT